MDIVLYNMYVKEGLENEFFFNRDKLLITYMDMSVGDSSGCYSYLQVLKASSPKPKIPRKYQVYLYYILLCYIIYKAYNQRPTNINGNLTRKISFEKCVTQGMQEKI